MASQLMVKRVVGAKIACLDFNLMKSKMKMGVQMLINDPEKLGAMRERESDITKERIEKILATGANVIFTTQGIDDMVLKYFVEKGAIAARRVSKQDMKQIARCTGATLCMTLANMDGEETYDASFLGHAEEVYQERICDDEVLVVSGTATSTSFLDHFSRIFLGPMPPQTRRVACALCPCCLC